MNLELTDEQIALRDTVRRFLAEKASIAGHVRPLLDDATGTTEQVWQGLAALGTTGLLVPQEYDGAGMTMIEAGIVLEELGAGLHPGPWLSSAVAAPRALMRFGVDSSVAAPLFTAIADGSTTVTVAALDGVRPEVVEHGDGVALRGEIDSVPDAAAADLILVLADEPNGTSLFAVQASAPGVDVTPLSGIDQTRKQFRVRFDDTPAHRLATAAPNAVEALIDDVVIAWSADRIACAPSRTR
jgi:alkylation response protein AidB-like acyl-CoA dehydrogenase